MWIITHIPSGKRFNLVPVKKKYVVGRVGSDIVLSDDTSISRSHAVFHITNEFLKLVDTGSKYGTYCNENIETKKKLPKGNPIEIKEGDRILFGALKNEWLICKQNINTMVSSLDGSQISQVKNLLNSIGGDIVSQWVPKCTHLTMSEITITIKVLHALIEKIPIVSCNYWKVFLKDVQDGNQPPKASLYLPKRSSFLSSAIDVASFSFNDKRKTLFGGKTFVFMSKKHCDMYAAIVIKAGGKCKDLKSNVHKSYLLQKDVIVIQYIPSSQTQGSQTINIISEYLEASSLRTIPEYEIGLAIVCCTIEKYCNPSYHTVSHVLFNLTETSPSIGTILAENTRPQRSELNTLELSAVEIPDSECLNDIAAPSKPLHSEIYEENKTGFDVITIQNSEDSKEDRILQISDSNGKNQRKGFIFNEKKTPTSKKVNISSLNTFSGNIQVTSLGEFSNKNKIQLSTESIETRVKTKRRMPKSDDDSRIFKKAHISIETNSKNFNEALDAFKGQSTSAADIIFENCIQSKSIETSIKSSNPLPLSAQTREKAVSRPRYSGFLQTSQIIRINRAIPPVDSNVNGMPESRVMPPTKRGRIALITDNDSDNDDDIFNFGSSPKKYKAPGNISDEELFGFGNTPSLDTSHQARSNTEEVLSHTQAFVPINKLKFTKAIIPTIKISALKSTSEGWISKLNLLKIKTNTDLKLNTEDDSEDTKRIEWIDSMRGVFEVRVRKMNLLSKESNCSEAGDLSHSTLNTSKKNFKAFVKKHNYKPQTHIVRTLPMIVAPLH